ncbi:MAG: hypothetical protein WAW61_21795 [Methylococcaceae bacterium]
MAIIRPRLNDYFELTFTQEEVDFAIPFLDEDIPLYLDPFLLWKSPSLQDNSLHTALINSFNHIGYLYLHGKEKEAISTLIQVSECREVGFGMGKTRKGLKIGKNVAIDIAALFRNIPQVQENGFTHFEEIQLLVDHVSKDRVSDIACNFLKSFLIDFTIEQAEKYRIPLIKEPIEVYDYRKNSLVEETIPLPQNPETNEPILLVPKRWLRYIPWINFDDYFYNYFVVQVSNDDSQPSQRIAILNYNRHNYDIVRSYTGTKERSQSDCKNDPLFTPIPIRSAKQKLNTIKALPTGKTDNADKKYEDTISQLMASLFYPNLDFAVEQSRTDSGVLIRDLLFYNNRSMGFLKDIYDDFGSRQIVMELKNVRELEREHINQLSRYLNDHLGHFGVLITRNPPPKAIFKNTIDLWAGQRKCIITLTDEDLKLMVSVFESKQRLPIEVLQRRYIDFMRACPS